MKIILKFKIIIVILLLSVITFAGWYFLFRPKTHEVNKKGVFVQDKASIQIQV